MCRRPNCSACACSTAARAPHPAPYILPPRTVQATALPGRTALLSVCLQYRGAHPAVVQDVALAPQDGCRVVSAAAPGLLPATLHPGSHLSLSFVLAMGVEYTAGGRGARRCLCFTCECGVPARTRRAARIFGDGLGACCAGAVGRHWWSACALSPGAAAAHSPCLRLDAAYKSALTAAAK